MSIQSLLTLVCLIIYTNEKAERGQDIWLLECLIEFPVQPLASASSPVDWHLGQLADWVEIDGEVKVQCYMKRL